MATLTLALAQNPAELDGPQNRLAWLSNALANGHGKGSDLLVLPELFLTGYNIGENIARWAEHKDGPASRQVARLCKEHGIAIHYSFPELFGNDLFNASSCLDKNGDYIGGHRKLILPPGFEGDHFSAGNACKMFTINGVNVGTLICYDAEFPENFREVSKLGADLILVPTALSSDWRFVANTVIPTRAFENGVYVAYANQCGNEHGMSYLGHSCITGPNGQDKARAGDGPEWLYSKIDTQKTRAAQNRLPYLQDVKTLQWDK
jgi:predicted amidohydrolase